MTEYDTMYAVDPPRAQHEGGEEQGQYLGGDGDVVRAQHINADPVERMDVVFGDDDGEMNALEPLGISCSVA